MGRATEFGGVQGRLMKCSCRAVDERGGKVYNSARELVIDGNRIPYFGLIQSDILSFFQCQKHSSQTSGLPLQHNHLTLQHQHSEHSESPKHSEIGMRGDDW